MELFNHFQNNALRFIVRLIGNRHLLWHNRPILAEELARKCRMLYAETITRETDEGERVYRIENIRLLDYDRLKNMLAVLLAAVYCASAWLGASVRRSILARNITRVAKRLFGVVAFHYYAIADGLATLFRRFGKWRGRQLADAASETSRQLELPLFGSG